MATILREVEGIPASWPVISSRLASPMEIEGRASDDWIWQRIEAFVAKRWASRSVEWIVEGDGEWVPPLTPATIATVEEWTGAAWEAVTLSPSPLGGYQLEADGPYRFTGTVGGGTVPTAVTKAAERLFNYCFVDLAIPNFWATALTAKDGIGGETQFDRPATWLARALINSGAADLLRPYRRFA